MNTPVEQPCKAPTSADVTWEERVEAQYNEQIASMRCHCPLEIYVIERETADERIRKDFAIMALGHTLSIEALADILARNGAKGESCSGIESEWCQKTWDKMRWYGNEKDERTQEIIDIRHSDIDVSTLVKAVYIGNHSIQEVVLGLTDAAKYGPIARSVLRWEEKRAE